MNPDEAYDYLKATCDERQMEAVEAIIASNTARGRAAVQDAELAKAYADIPYYRHLGGHAYKQHMAHIRKLERIAKSGKKEQN